MGVRYTMDEESRSRWTAAVDRLEASFLGVLSRKTSLIAPTIVAFGGEPPTAWDRGPARRIAHVRLHRAAGKLQSKLPDDLIDFFHVNTDAGAYELACAVARRFEGSAVVVRCLVPRTLIDCNRRLDATPAELTEGKVTPGLMPWIEHPDDRALLADLHAGYVAAVKDAMSSSAEGVCCRPHLRAAQRRVAVDAESEEPARAYQPDKVNSGAAPRDRIIGRDVEDRRLAPAPLTVSMKQELGALGLGVTDSATYPLHPSTLAWGYHQERPRHTLCLEVRRDLLADPFDPFVEMNIGATKVEPIAAAIARALSSGTRDVRVAGDARFLSAAGGPTMLALALVGATPARAEDARDEFYRERTRAGRSRRRGRGRPREDRRAGPTSRSPTMPSSSSLALRERLVIPDARPQLPAPGGEFPHSRLAIRAQRRAEALAEGLGSRRRRRGPARAFQAVLADVGKHSREESMARSSGSSPHTRPGPRPRARDSGWPASTSSRATSTQPCAWSSRSRKARKARGRCAGGRRAEIS